MSISFGANSNPSFEPACVFEKNCYFNGFFKIFRKIAENVTVSGILDLYRCPSRKTFKKAFRKVVCSTSSRRKPG